MSDSEFQSKKIDVKRLNIKFWSKKNQINT